MSQIKKKMGNENIHVVNYSLQVNKFIFSIHFPLYELNQYIFLKCIESMVKNCGSKVHQEIATKDFMDLMRGIAGVSQYFY